MSPQSFQSVDVGVVLVGVVMAALLVTLIALGLRSRRRRERSRLGVAAMPSAVEAPAAAKPSALDGAALIAAIDEAEAAGQQSRLPGLYLLLAQWRLDGGETSAAAELLRQVHPRRDQRRAEGCARQRSAGARRSRPGRGGSRHGMRALADRTVAVPRAAPLARARRGRGAHAQKRLSRRIGC